MVTEDGRAPARHRVVVDTETTGLRDGFDDEVARAAYGIRAGRSVSASERAGARDGHRLADTGRWSR